MKRNSCCKTDIEIDFSLSLQITFRNVFKKDYCEWDTRPDGDIYVEKIVDRTTQQVKDWNELSIHSQIDIRSKCFDYLRVNHLLRYPNVFPFQWVPHRAPSFRVDKTYTAEIIVFPKIK